MFRLFTVALLAASVAPAFGQISSSCNPISVNQTTPCPADPALGTSHTWNMANDTLGNTDIWNVTNGAVDYSNGLANFVINTKGEAPTIKSNFYFLWGGSGITLKAAKGQGIVSSLTFLSDDLDEIDWEWIGGNNTHVQTNYFGKGNTSVYDRAVWVPVNDPIGTFHNYSINWSSSELQWLIDGNVVRSLPYAQADGHGQQFPQTPLDVRMGIWAGGDESLGNSNWTVQWAGGPVDYSQTPFTMSVQSVSVNDGSKGAMEYTYGDKTGNYQSIKIAQGNSTAFNSINAPPQQTIVQKFDGLSTTAKIGIAVGLGVAVLLLGACCTFCCVRQRRSGRRERQAAEADWDRANSEMLAYRKQGIDSPALSPAPGRNADPFSDSKTYLPQSAGGYSQNAGGYPHESYHLSPQSPHPQYATQQYRF